MANAPGRGGVVEVGGEAVEVLVAMIASRKYSKRPVLIVRSRAKYRSARQATVQFSVRIVLVRSVALQKILEAILSHEARIAMRRSQLRRSQA